MHTAAVLPTRPGPTWRLAVPLLVGLLLVGWLRHFPVQPVLVGAGLLASAALVAWRPAGLWWLVGLALPGVDLAPWSGRLALDEFDALLALLLAVAWWRTPAAPATTARTRPDPLLRTALLAVALSLLLSTARALLPWAAPDLDAFASLFSPFNALRVVRGAVWAGLLLWLARRQRAAGWDVVGALGNGLVLGLAGTVGFIVLERLQFTTLLDFTDGYRVAGPFSAMHTGGAYVECYLVVALPFLLARLRPPAPAWRLVVAALLLVAAVYAVMVTFSRSGYAALAVALAVSVLPSLAGRLPSARQRTAATSLAVLGLVAAVAWPVLSDSFAQSRLKTVDRDLVTRQAHWSQVLGLMDGDTLSLLLGMGIGRLPAVNLLHSPADARSASYRLVDAAGERFVRLGAGRAVYIEQAVHTQPGQRYSLQLRLRAAAPGAALGIHLCEKSLLTSATCARTSVQLTAGGDQWVQVSSPLDSAGVGQAGPGLARPVKLGFQLLGPVALDLAQIQLVGPDGSPLLHNSDFAQGMDHWFFTADHHLAWHAKSLPVALLFDQGVLGLLALGGLLLLALARAGRAAWAGQAGAVPLLAALAAFCTVGVVDTLIDAPRFLLLWLLLCGLAAGLRPGLGAAPR